MLAGLAAGAAVSGAAAPGTMMPSGAAGGIPVSSTGSNLGLDIGLTFCVGVNEAQRRHAISADAYFAIPNDDVPAIRPVLDGGDELATVVDVLRSRQLVLARVHSPPPFSSCAERQRSP